MYGVTNQCNTPIRKGQIWMVDLSQNETESRQGGRTRPCIIVSNDKNNLYSPMIQIVPLTSNLNKANIPVHVILGRECGLLQTSLGLVEQSTCIPKNWLQRLIGQCTYEKMIEIERASRLQRGEDKRLMGLLDTINNLDIMIQNHIEIPEMDSIKMTKAIMMSELKGYCKYQNLDYDFIVDNYVYTYVEKNYRVG